MRIQLHDEYWKWIAWLIILMLLNAIALAAGRGGRRGDDKSSSESKQQPTQTQRSSPPSAPKQRPTQARESRPASRPASRSASQSASRPAAQSRKTEPTVSVSRSSAPARESRSRTQSSRSTPAVSSRSRTRTVGRTRSVQHEVIVAPSSQSLNVSSSTTITRAVPSRTSGSTVRSGRGRTVEVKKPQSEQSENSAAPTIRPDPGRPTETIRITADNSKTSQRQGGVSDSSRQPRNGTERKNRPQVTESGTVSNPSITTADTVKSPGTSVAASSPAVSDSSAPLVRSGNSRRNRTGTVIRNGEKGSGKRKNEPVIVTNDDINVQPQISRPSRPERQRTDNRDRALQTQSHDNTVIALRTDNQEQAHRSGNPGSSGHRPDSRWSRLRTKITTQAEFDTQSRVSRSDGDSHSRRDGNRGRVVINNNNIHVERGDRNDHHRPYVSRHLFRDIRPIRSDHRWRPYGSSFIFRWSDSSCGRVILAPYDGYYGISYYYPAYHRRYLFVSLGGYWPYSYRYQRYYWYGCHPYYWYGSYAVSQPDRVVYDYTTYNYYNSTASVAPEAITSNDLIEDSTATDTPLPQTQADICFADAVNAFEQGRYEDAGELFRQAVLMSPEDEILPFTYTQALFASGDYALAAYVLREVMAKMPSEDPAVYFPRGLYKEDQILTDQIARLEYEITIEPFSTDYQLLLGYQCLGLGQWEKAVNALEQAARNPLNVNVVSKLLDIAEKMEKDALDSATAP